MLCHLTRWLISRTADTGKKMPHWAARHAARCDGLPVLRFLRWIPSFPAFRGSPRLSGRRPGRPSSSDCSGIGRTGGRPFLPVPVLPSPSSGRGPCPGSGRRYFPFPRPPARARAFGREGSGDDGRAETGRRRSRRLARGPDRGRIFARAGADPAGKFRPFGIRLSPGPAEYYHREKKLPVHLTDPGRFDPKAVFCEYTRFPWTAYAISPSSPTWITANPPWPTAFSK